MTMTSTQRWISFLNRQDYILSSIRATYERVWFKMGSKTQALSSKTYSANDPTEIWLNVIEKSLAFGGPAVFSPYNLNSHCEAALLQEPTIFVCRHKYQVDIPGRAVKSLIHRLMFLHKCNHHEVSVRGKVVTNGLMIPDNHCPFLFINVKIKSKIKIGHIISKTANSILTY